MVYKNILYKIYKNILHKKINFMELKYHLIEQKNVRKVLYYEEINIKLFRKISSNI